MTNRERTKQLRLIVTETRNVCEYDPAQALRVWRLLLEELPTGPDARGFTEYPSLSDDDRIVYCFELLDGSLFGDMIFGDLANLSVRHELIERSEDG